MPACVSGLAAVHASDRYPLNWPADPSAWLTPRGLLLAWVAEMDGAVVGHALVQRTHREGVADFGRLFVVPAARRRSAATALLARATAWAAANGYGLTLTVTDGPRSAAVEFYQRAGWRFTHTSPAGFADPAGRPVTLRHYVAPD